MGFRYQQLCLENMGALKSVRSTSHALRPSGEFHRLKNKTLILRPGARGSVVFFCLFFSLLLVCEAIGTAAAPGLLCQPRVIMKMIVEKQMECTLAGKTEVLGENLPQRHFCPSQNTT
jgi:hypothetical protein